MIKRHLALALLVLPATISFAQVVPLPTWPCTGRDQTVHDSNGEDNQYTETLPGGAWNEGAAAAEAAENYHGRVTCAGCPQGESGCIKSVDWTYDKISMDVTWVDSALFRFTIENFKVWGNCSECE